MNIITFCVCVCVCVCVITLHNADCIGSQYGYECGEICACMNGGSCDNTIGCVCPDGWTGTMCSFGKPLHYVNPTTHAA